MGLIKGYIPKVVSLLQRRWIGVSMVIGSVITAGITILICFVVAGGSRGIDVSHPPSISSFGDKMPEHAIFAIGLGVVGVLIFCIIVMRAIHIDCLLDESSSSTSIWTQIIAELFNVFLLLVGLMHFVPLVMMASIPRSDSRLHFHMAITSFAIIAFYALLHALFSFILTYLIRFFDNDHPQRLALASSSLNSTILWVRRGVALLWWLSLSIVAPVFAFMWMQSKNNLFEWIGVLSLFLYLLPFALEFWLAPRDLQRIGIMGRGEGEYINLWEDDHD